MHIELLKLCNSYYTVFITFIRKEEVRQKAVRLWRTDEAYFPQKGMA
jgi:hypothetical protein